MHEKKFTPPPKDSSELRKMKKLEIPIDHDKKGYILVPKYLRKKKQQTLTETVNKILKLYYDTPD